MKHLYSVHGENELDYPGSGYVVLTRGIGRDPNDLHGEDFSHIRQTPIVRLNHGYYPHGTIPEPEYYTDFAMRCAHFVDASRGCHIWIIGNEPNHSQERPDGRPIEPAEYALCYSLCRAAIRAQEFHTGDQVLLAAVAPWNVETRYDGNESGDWVQYFEDVQHELSATDLDGFAFHTYARDQTPESITSLDRMDPPFEFHHNGFRTYTDWMAAIFPRFQGLPVYITEFCIAGVPWQDANTRCVQEAYRDINTWNELYPDRLIECLTMYRWRYDQWAFSDKPGVIADFMSAVGRGYTVPPGTDPPQGDDMLLNPSFEGDWYNQTEDGILVLPEHWRAEYQEDDNPYKRPEIKPNEEYVTDGQFSIRAFPPQHSRGFYGICQDVPSEPGQWYKFSADVRVESEPSGKLGAFVGIQPWGGSIFHRQMIWGEEIVNSHDWTRVEVIAQAFGGVIRVSMGADNEFASKGNTTWWDNAKLELWDCEGGTEPPVDPPDPPGGDVDYERIRRIVREELDRTVWAAEGS